MARPASKVFLAGSALVVPSGVILMSAEGFGGGGGGAVTLVPNGAAKINGINANRALSSPWATYEITSNGTDWFVSGN